MVENHTAKVAIPALSPSAALSKLYRIKYGVSITAKHFRDLHDAKTGQGSLRVREYCQPCPTIVKQSRWHWWHYWSVHDENEHKQQVNQTIFKLFLQKTLMWRFKEGWANSWQLWPTAFPGFIHSAKMSTIKMQPLFQVKMPHSWFLQAAAFLWFIALLNWIILEFWCHLWCEMRFYYYFTNVMTFKLQSID